MIGIDLPESIDAAALRSFLQQFTVVMEDMIEFHVDRSMGDWADRVIVSFYDRDEHGLRYYEEDELAVGEFVIPVRALTIERTALLMHDHLGLPLDGLRGITIRAHDRGSDVRDRVYTIHAWVYAVDSEGNGYLAGDGDMATHEICIPVR